MKPRDLRECECNICGSNFAVNYDVANDEYICDECHSKEDEEQDYSDDLEETKEEQLMRRNK